MDDDGLRVRVLEALARGDGQLMDGFDLGHTAEMMYGRQADAVLLLLGQEVRRFAQEVAREIDRDADLGADRKQAKGARHAARDLRLAGKARAHKAQSGYNRTDLAKPLQIR